MKVLAMDTSGLGASVALARDGEVCARAEHDLARGYAESLFGLFDRVLAEAAWTREDIQAVAAVQGPGSFTGLRVGLMTAKTLSHSRGWTLYLAHAHDLLAAQHTGHACDVRTVSAAGRGHAYVRSYRREGAEDGGLLRAQAEAERIANPQLATWAQGSEGEVLVEAVFHDEVSADLPGAKPAPESLVAALARTSSLERWPARATSVAEAAPLYLGTSQAERVHGVDLTEEIRRPRPPVSWD